MATFLREGRCEGRSAFLLRLRAKLQKLRSGPLAAMTEVWEQENGWDVVRLSGFGVTLRFVVGEESWRCEGELPEWLPIPPEQIENRFDAEFADLMGTGGGFE